MRDWRIVTYGAWVFASITACVVLLWPAAGFAYYPNPRACGNNVNGVRVECRCGDVIVDDYTFTQDIGPCDNSFPGDFYYSDVYYGLIIHNDDPNKNITIDCQGKKLYSSSSPVGNFGFDATHMLKLGNDINTACWRVVPGNPPVYEYRQCAVGASQSHVTLQNCQIEGFYTGIGLRRSTDWNITDNVLSSHLNPDMTVATMRYGITGDFDVDNSGEGTDIKIVDNDFLEMQMYGVWLRGLKAGSEISGNRITAYDDNTAPPNTVKPEAGIYLEQPLGSLGNTIKIQGNYVDCPSITQWNNLNTCYYSDLFFNELDGNFDIKYVDVYNNVFAGDGVGFLYDLGTNANTVSFVPPSTTPDSSCVPADDGICDKDCLGQPPPNKDPDCESKYNIFPNVKTMGVHDGSCNSTVPANTCDPDCLACRPDKAGGADCPNAQYDPDCSGLPRNQNKYNAHEYVKPCITPPFPWDQTFKITENTCFTQNTALTFNPTLIAHQPNPPAIEFTADNVILDCNWRTQFDTGNISAGVNVRPACDPNLEPGLEHCNQSIGILARGRRLTSAEDPVDTLGTAPGYAPRSRGTIVGCKVSNFNTGVLLENSQDFLLRWNWVQKYSGAGDPDTKAGFYYQVKSDHLQDCFSPIPHQSMIADYTTTDADGDGFPCEPSPDGSVNRSWWDGGGAEEIGTYGVADPDQHYPGGTRLTDYRHFIYNAAFRPKDTSGNPRAWSFNWVLTPVGQWRQTLYFYNVDGMTIDGQNDAYFSLLNVGHLTIANSASTTVKNFGPFGNVRALSGYDPLTLACVGTERSNDRCDTPTTGTTHSPVAWIQNVSVENARVGFYNIDTARLIFEQSSARNNGYDFLFFRTASTTIGGPSANCASSFCATSQGSTEGLRVQGPSSKVLVWNAKISGNSGAGALFYDTTNVTMRATTIENSGSAGTTDAVGLGIFRVDYSNFEDNIFQYNDGDNVLIKQGEIPIEGFLDQLWFTRNVITGSKTGWGVRINNAPHRLEGMNIFFGWQGWRCPLNSPNPQPPCDGYNATFWPVTPGVNNTVRLNRRGGIYVSAGNALQFYRNVISENGGDGVRADEWASSLDIAQNEIYANAGWGVYAQDVNDMEVASSTIGKTNFPNRAGGVFIADRLNDCWDYANPFNCYAQSNQVVRNQIIENTGPGILVHAAAYQQLMFNTVRFPTSPRSVPGIVLLNTTKTSLQGNTIVPIGAAVTVPLPPYLTVRYDPAIPMPVGFLHITGSQYAQQKIYQSNTAAPAGVGVVTQVFEFQDDFLPNLSYQGTADLNLSSGTPSQNRNGDAQNIVDGDACNFGGGICRNLLRWDIDLLPAHCKVQSVRVAVNTVNPTGSRFAVYGMRSSWVETEATWQKAYDTYNGDPIWWGSVEHGTYQQGATDTTTDRFLSDLVDTNSTSGWTAAGNGYVEIPFDVDGVTLVQQWIDGSQYNYGIIVHEKTGTSDGHQWSKRADPNDNLHPKLSITCQLSPSVYYYGDNTEYLGVSRYGVKNLLPVPSVGAPDTRTIEKTCAGGANHGHLCQVNADCDRGTCVVLDTYHLQISNSDSFTVRNLRGIAASESALVTADPLQLDYVTNSDFDQLQFKDCLGACVRLSQSSPYTPIGLTPQENFFSGLVIENPSGSGIEVRSSNVMQFSRLRVFAGVEGDAISVKNVKNFNLVCASAASCSTDPLYPPPTGGGTSPGGDLPGRNDLQRGADATNQFWEMQMSGLAEGEVLLTRFQDRGVFEMKCRPGRDNCCLAVKDEMCDTDCGLSSEDKPLDPDCENAAINPLGFCTKSGGDCCQAAVDEACDPDCPHWVDPDCWIPTGMIGGVMYSPMSYNAPQRLCENIQDGCCNPSADNPPVCDIDCTPRKMNSGVAYGDIDPDCDPTWATLGDGCWPGWDIGNFCDLDCPSGVDPHCGVDSATGAPCETGATCVLNSDVSNSTGPDDRCTGLSDGICDPDCIGDGDYGDTDPDCDFALCTSRPAYEPQNRIQSGGGCVLDPDNGSPLHDSICDRDCGPLTTTGNPPVDGDCTAIDCCYPAVDGICDYDCPFGVDADCTKLSPSCYPAVDSVCDSNCPSGADPDCGSDVICQPWLDGMCDYDCPSGTAPQPMSASGGGCTPNSPANTCDPDCIAAGTDPDCDFADPDCPAPAYYLRDGDSGCKPYEDGRCDQDCIALGTDPDCGSNNTNFSLDGVCNTDSTYFSPVSGMPYDPDCGKICSSVKDGCCVPADNQNGSHNQTAVCDQDCGVKADGSPMDPDCSAGCTKAEGDCCLPNVDEVCDIDCPAGVDPDCTSDVNYCADRSFSSLNDYPAAYVVPLEDDTNYPYEKGVPDQSDSCVAPLPRFNADDSSPSQAISFAEQFKIPRLYTRPQRMLARGDVKIEAEYSDYEGSDVDTGIFYSPEVNPWIDPNSTSGWFQLKCDTSTNANPTEQDYWCSQPRYNADDSTKQPTGETAPLPLPRQVYPSTPPGPAGPPPYPSAGQPHPSVDNDFFPGIPFHSWVGARIPIVTRMWPNQTTAFAPNFRTDVSFYWAAANSNFRETNADYNGWRLPVWIELAAFDSGGCTSDAAYGCFSAGQASVVLCDTVICPTCELSCVKNSANGMLDDWTRRQRVMLDLQGPVLPTAPVATFDIQTQSPEYPNTCGFASGFKLYSRQLTWPQAEKWDTNDPLETTGEVLPTAASPYNDYPSWTQYNTLGGNLYGAHYEIWYGVNDREVIDHGEINCSEAGGECDHKLEGETCGTSGTCIVGDGNPANGPFVWEDIHRLRCSDNTGNCWRRILGAACSDASGTCITASGLPHESCDWEKAAPSAMPTFDPNLGKIDCGGTWGAGLCGTTLWTALSDVSTPLYFNICAVDDFGNESNCLYSNPVAWTQAKYGDIFAGGNIGAESPATSNNATFLITSVGTITNWQSSSTYEGDGTIEGYPVNSWEKFPNYYNDFTTPAGSIWFLQGFNGASGSNAQFTAVINKLIAKYGSTRVVNLGVTMCGGGASSLPATNILGGKIYYYAGNCTIGTALTFQNGSGVNDDGSALFLINGNLTINQPIQYGSSNVPSKLKHIASATWMVLGGVTVNTTVTRVDSNFIALGSFAKSAVKCNTDGTPACGILDTGAGATSLTVRGIAVARMFRLSRTMASLSSPSEGFIYDGRIAANPPPGLEQIVQSLPLWKP